MRGKCNFVTMEFDGISTKNVGEEDIVHKIPASVLGLTDDAAIIGSKLILGEKEKPKRPETPGPKPRVYKDEEEG